MPTEFPVVEICEIVNWTRNCQNNWNMADHIHAVSASPNAKFECFQAESLRTLLS